MDSDPSTHPDPNELPAEVTAALQRGEKIEAIKLLRAAREIGLKEAKEQIDAYLSGRPMPAGPADSDLPTEVIAALAAGNKLEAIKLLRTARPIGLNAAKEQVEAYQGGGFSGAARAPRKNLWVTVAVVVACVWALVTSLDAVSSLVVLAHLGGYQAETFTIDKLRHDADGEGGLLWGFEGRIAGREERLYAPHLADAKKLGFGGLRKLYPPGTELPAWYNPEVTATLFQGRSLRVIPYTEDLQASELQRCFSWVLNSLLPLLLVLFLARRLNRAQSPKPTFP